MIKRYLFVAPIKIKKKIGCMISKWQFCAAKLAKSANYAGSAFFGNYMKIMFVKTNHAEIMLAQSKPSEGARERRSSETSGLPKANTTSGTKL